MNLPIKPINPRDRIISIKGKVIYNDKRKRIDIKRPIKDLFDKNKKIRYIMEICFSESKLKNRIKELTKGNILPLLLYFTEE